MMGLIGLGALSLSLVPAVGAAAREQNPTEVQVAASGTLEAKVYGPGGPPEGWTGSSTVTVSVKWSEKEVFDASTGDPVSSPKLTVDGTETFFDDRTFQGTPVGTAADNCTAKLSAKPYRQWKHIALMAGTIDQYGSSKGDVTAFAYVPAADQTSSFINSKGPGDCSTYEIPFDPSPYIYRGRNYGNKEMRWLASHWTERAHFRDTELSFKVRHEPFRYNHTAYGLNYSAEMINRFSVTTS